MARDAIYSDTAAMTKISSTIARRFNVTLSAYEVFYYTVIMFVFY